MSPPSPSQELGDLIAKLMQLTGWNVSILSDGRDVTGLVLGSESVIDQVLGEDSRMWTSTDNSRDN